jgi:hypothetical protein
MSLLTDGTVTKFGHFNPYLFFGTACVAITGGLISTWKVDTGYSMIDGIQVLGGLGAACVIQMVRLFCASFYIFCECKLNTSFH